MCDPLSAAVIISAGAGIAGGYMQANAASSAAEAEARALERNAVLDEIAASDAQARGGSEAGKSRMSTSDLIARQKVAYAASGVRTDTGSPADVQASTRGQGELDALTIENNAAREAWGYRVGAANKRRQAYDVRKTGQAQADAALITGYTRGATAILGTAARRRGAAVPTRDEEQAGP